ncbi:hypothetical protein ZWY2020_046218 [Hordeum vulgare]|nr:hypothetical protein ZWY2020_046218 [Hordeum vulgare]
MRLPLVVYVHGGSFCTESAFSRTYHRYATSLAASAGVLVVSVEYRLAPEYPVPASYDDTWAALRWVASLSDPWLAQYADPGRTFLAGDSAGGNIAYHTALRATHDDTIMDIEGLVIVHPFFWGLERLPAEKVSDGDVMFPPVCVDKLWPFVTKGQAGNDDPRINPPDEELTLLTGKRVLVAIAEKDTLRDRGRRFASTLRRCGWTDDNLTMVESEGEDHVFHLCAPLRATSKNLMKSIVHFINQRATLPSPSMVMSEQECSSQPMLGVPSQMSCTEKRYFHHTEELLDANPDFLCRGKPSLDARLAIAAAAAPELAALAAAKAIAKWGRPASDITHLVVSTNSGAHAPGADLRLASLLGLRASVCRTMLNLNGCSAGSTSLRLAKDLAENNRAARVLVACVELTVVAFRGPEEEYPHHLISQGTAGLSLFRLL